MTNDYDTKYWSGYATFVWMQIYVENSVRNMTELSYFVTN